MSIFSLHILFKRIAPGLLFTNMTPHETKIRGGSRRSDVQGWPQMTYICAVVFFSTRYKNVVRTISPHLSLESIAYKSVADLRSHPAALVNHRYTYRYASCVNGSALKQEHCCKRYIFIYVDVGKKIGCVFSSLSQAFYTWNLKKTYCTCRCVRLRHCCSATRTSTLTFLQEFPKRYIFFGSIFFPFLLSPLFRCVTAGRTSLHSDTKCYPTVHALFAMVQSSSTYKFILYMNVIAMVKLHCVYVCIHCTTVRLKSTAACCVIARLHLLARTALRCLTHN